MMFPIYLILVLLCKVLVTLDHVFKWKRGAELSADHHLVESWISWWGRLCVWGLSWEQLAEDHVTKDFNSHLKEDFVCVPEATGHIESEGKSVTWEELKVRGCSLLGHPYPFPWRRSTVRPQIQELYGFWPWDNGPALHPLADYLGFMKVWQSSLHEFRRLEEGLQPSPLRRLAGSARVTPLFPDWDEAPRSYKKNVWEIISLAWSENSLGSPERDWESCGGWRSLLSIPLRWPHVD